MVNAVGSIGSTLNKFYMCLHRYFVLRELAVNEDVRVTFYGCAAALIRAFILVWHVLVLCKRPRNS